MLTIRPITENDIASCAHINVATWQHAYAGIIDANYLAEMSTQDFLNKWQDIYNSLPQAPHKYFMVAEDMAGQVCGYSSIEVPNDTSRWATQLTTLYVLPNAPQARHWQTIAGCCQKLGVTARC